MRRFASLALLLSACATSSTRGPVKLPPPKADALTEFDAAVRLMKLGPAQYPRALERLAAARGVDRNLWEAWFDTGWILQNTHRQEEAAQAYEEALRIAPNHAATVQALGEVYLSARRWSDAKRVFREAIKSGTLSPTITHTLRIQLASALRQEGHYEDALSEIRAVLRAEPRSALALGELALVYQARKQHELAQLVIRRAIELSGENPHTAATLWNNLGLILLGLRSDQEAFAAFDKAASLDPQLTIARYNRAAVFLDCGDYGRASKELQHLTESDPENFAAWIALGVAHRGMGKFADAQHAYERAIELDPNQPDARYNLGVLLMDFVKDPKGARDQLDRFMSLSAGSHPKRADAERRLQQLSGAHG